MRILFAIAFSLLLAGSTYAEDAAPARPTAAHKIASLAYLTGTWEGPMWGGIFRAQYGAPSKDTLLSYSRLIKSSTTAFHEFEVFEIVDGKLVLTPHPGGKPASTFALTSVDVAKQTATFEAPKNDFPSRIVYTRNKNRLTITLTAPHHKSDKQETFVLKLII